MTDNANEWLAYDIDPRQLKASLRPAMWGNGQLQVLAELERPCVNHLVCFGFGSQAIVPIEEEHVIPAVYDAKTGKKYFLSSSPLSGAIRTIVTFRPDRQIWQYEYDDLTARVTLILPRLVPGYLIKIQLIPQESGKRHWYVYQQVTRLHGRGLFDVYASGSGYDLRGGEVWFTNDRSKHCEAIGATIDAKTVNLGEDEGRVNEVMVQLAAASNKTDGSSEFYCARSFGLKREDVINTLHALLTSPENTDDLTDRWWQDYLNEVPRLEIPDEAFAKNFLWSWANYRVNRLDVPVGKVPAGMPTTNNGGLYSAMALFPGDNPEEEAIQLLHDPQPARDFLLTYLRETSKVGLISRYWNDGHDMTEYRTSPSSFCCLCGLLYKYMLSTSDLEILAEDIGGITVFQRLQRAAQAQLEFRDNTTGLYRIGDYGKISTDPVPGLSPNLESVARYRGGEGTFYNDVNAVIDSSFKVMAEIAELVNDNSLAEEYAELAASLYEAVQKYMWCDAIGFFCDVKKDGSQSDYLGIGGFMTGLIINHVWRAGGLATDAQAEKLAQWCNHPDFYSEFGVVSLARSHPYFDPSDMKGFSGGIDMHWCNQIPTGLYAHGCYHEAEKQLFKLFKRLGDNCGLGPRYRGEAYHSDTGEILPWRFQNYPAILSALTAVIEGVFGLQWTNTALQIKVHSPWRWAQLSNLRLRGKTLDLSLSEEGVLRAKINGREVASTTSKEIELPWYLFEQTP